MVMDEKIEYFKLPFYKRLSSIFVDIMFVFTLFIVFLLVASMIIPSVMNNDEKLNEYSSELSIIKYDTGLFEIDGKVMVEVYEDENITAGFEYTNNLDVYNENKEQSGLFEYVNGEYVEIGEKEELEKFYKDNWNIALNYVYELDDYKYYNELFQKKYQKYVEILLSVPAIISAISLLIIVPLCNKEGKTLAKMIFKVSVVNSNLELSNRLQIFIRQFFFVLFTVTFVPTIVSFIISLFNKDGKTLHDYVSSTRVIDSKVRGVLLSKIKKDEKETSEDELVF